MKTFNAYSNTQAFNQLLQNKNDKVLTKTKEKLTRTKSYTYKTNHTINQGTKNCTGTTRNSLIYDGQISLQNAMY